MGDFGESRKTCDNEDQDGICGTIYGDSSAAIAISQRRGCGKLRHIHIGQLWIQDKVFAKELVVSKINGEDHPADLLTKHVNESKKDKYCSLIMLESRMGKATSGLNLQGSTGSTYSFQSSGVGSFSGTSEAFVAAGLEDLGEQGTRQGQEVSGRQVQQVGAARSRWLLPQ